MLAFDRDQHRLVGPYGALPVLEEDDITRKLAMLIEGECDALGPRQAAETFGFSKSRYYQIRKAFQLHGAKALASQKRGPKRQYRRTQEVTRQVIRHRFLDPDATAEVIAQKLRQTGLKISTRSVERVIEDFGLQKKLHRYPPQPEAPVDTHRTKKRTQPEPCDPTSLERGVRQLLADKISGNLVGLWLLVPEHLRLGTWDLLCGWTGHPTPRLEPRVALQLIHEAALCVTGVRQQRTLSQKGFELLNGLPFVVTDMAVHQLLRAHTITTGQKTHQTQRCKNQPGHHVDALVPCCRWKNEKEGVLQPGIKNSPFDQRVCADQLPADTVSLTGL